MSEIDRDIARDRDGRRLGEVAPATAGRVTLAATVQFIVMYIAALALQILVITPLFVFIMLPIIAGKETNSPPDAAMVVGFFALAILAALFVAIAANAVALRFIIGKRWGGARLLFVYD